MTEQTLVLFAMPLLVLLLGIGGFYGFGYRLKSDR